MYQLNSNFTSYINYVNRTSTTEDLEESLNDYKVNGLQAGINYLRYSDSRLQPENIILHMDAGYNRRRLSNTSTSNEQYEVSLRVAKLWKLRKKLFLKTSTEFYLLETEDLQFNELRQIGGLHSIRGFKQNTIDTPSYLLLQSDFRYLLNDQIYVNLINDVGYFRDYYTENHQYLYGFGAGFGIETKAGILQLQVAKGNFINSNPSSTNTIAHINFLISF